MKAIVPPKFTAAERKARDQEIYRQLAQNVRKLEKSLIAMVLYRLHTYPKAKFGKQRLLEFYECFRDDLKALEEYYDMTTTEDIGFLYATLLKNETGIDVEELPGSMFDFGFRVKEK